MRNLVVVHMIKRKCGAHKKDSQTITRQFKPQFGDLV